MKFKSRLAIPRVVKESTSDYLKVHDPHFIFSKTLLRFPKDIQEKFTHGFPTDLKNDKTIWHKTKYTLVKLDGDHPARTKRSRFQVFFHEIGHTQNLVTSEWQLMKMNIIHQRYWVQKNGDWFVKTVVATLVGAILALAAQRVGYHEGYEQGIKDASFQHQQAPSI